MSDYHAYLTGLFSALDPDADAPILSTGELARHGMTWEDVARDITPLCAVVRSKERIKPGHPDLPPGTVMLTVWILGTDDSRKGKEWAFFTQDRLLTDPRHTLTQVLWCDGLQVTRRTTCLQTPDGPVVRQTDA
ncbi:MAG: hypothetical protein KDE22_07450 [Rhodobacterales bacterium]|nr:hypothetical protein [Rhodobacterales bacterium]